ncbi:MAG: hypothetical protein A2138_14155 [Deltaproteobacteria bacterium RBG_16_71_12]|nr:MAG: hypothetical protein A2138_14155 [Deltaproteobacteria bacterium RBG_16_71_12]
MQKTINMTLATGLLAAGLALPAWAGDKDPAAAADESVVQKVGHGEINWSKKTVTATGSGAANLKDGPVAVARLNAERAAKLDALRNVIETIQGIQVTASRSAGDVMSNGEIRSRIQGMAQGFKVIDTKYYSDGSVDVVVQMPIDENLTNALVEKPKRPKKVSGGGAASFTGLIVNARGLGLTPSMAPRIVDEAGKEVYGTEVVSEKGLKQGGIVGYVKADAQAGDRVGDKPLVVKGLRLVDKSKTDLVIANGDADKLRDPTQNLSFLADGKVVILVD